jgi:hypothetical protein
MGHAVAQLRHCATSRKVVASIPDGVIGIFHSDRTMALGSTQSLTEMSTRNISLGGKSGRSVGLTLPHARADCHEILEPQGLSRDCCICSRTKPQSTDTHTKLRLSLLGSRPEINTGLQEVGTREQSKQVKSFQVVTSKYVTRGWRDERNRSYITNYHSKLKYTFFNVWI